MGRTNRTYRNHLDAFIQKFSSFEKALRKDEKKHLNQLWEKAHRYSQAASYMNSPRPLLPAIISVLIGIQKETQNNREDIEKLKTRVKELECEVEDV